MLHRELSESCQRAPGIPPSECWGMLHPKESVADGAQPLDGYGPDDTVAVDISQCALCGAYVVVRHSATGWRLSNEYHW